MHITKTEKRILELLYLTNKKIAQKLFVDVSTIKTHIHILLVKFNSKTRTELYMKAIKAGEVKL
jgi:DNA-binding NarL/FixJ family response regulator